VEGRLVRLVQHLDPNPSFTVALMFHTIYAGAKTYEVSLAPMPSPSQFSGGIDRSADNQFSAANDRSTAVFQFPGHTLALGRNFVSAWVTIPK
jgi:hypothetical protein